MLWIAPSEKDTDYAALVKRIWIAAATAPRSRAYVGRVPRLDEPAAYLTLRASCISARCGADLAAEHRAEVVHVATHHERILVDGG